MCLNVRYGDYSSGQQIITYNCDGGATGNEKFYLLPCSTSGACGASYGLIEPVGAYPSRHVCLNIAGGFGLGHNIILYDCEGYYTNELFSLPGWP
jgi:hypothetical protein